MALLRSVRWTVRYLHIIYIALLLATVNADGSVTITSQPAYSSMRPCARQCIWCGEYWLANCPSGAIGINNIISCYIDSCYCRTDLQSSALSYVTSCILSGCNDDSVDLSEGVSLYSGYCSINGATLNNYPAATTAAGTTTLSAAPGTTPTRASSTSMPAAASAGLSTGGVIGIAVSVACSVFGLLFGVAFKIWKYFKTQNRYDLNP